MAIVLVLTNEPSIDQLCWQALTRVGHEVISVKSVPDAIRASLAIRVSTSVIDASGIDDLEAAAAWLRNNLGEGARLVFLASGGTRLAALPIDPEVDEFVVKPCSADAIRDAVARALSRTGSAPETLLVGGLELSRGDRTVRNQSGAVKLTPREFDIIEYLAANHDRLVSTAELAEKIWRRPPNAQSWSIVSSSMKNLRDKIQRLPDAGGLIQTFPRRGYLLEASKAG